MQIRMLLALLLLTVTASIASAADALDADLQAKVDSQIKDIRSWASDPAIVAAVKAQNAAPSDEVKAMTQDKWKSLALTDTFVRSLAKNATAAFLKTKKSELISEAFVSAADGTKVAFLAKTTNWSHKGNAKHENPMAGKTWQGSVEVDESTGVKQLQVSVAIEDGGKVIGSLVVGLNVANLK